MAAQKRHWGMRNQAAADPAKDALRGAARRRLAGNFAQKPGAKKSVDPGFNQDQRDGFAKAISRGQKAGVVTGGGTRGSTRVPFIPRTKTGRPAAGATPRGFNLGDFTKGANGGPSGNVQPDGRPVPFRRVPGKPDGPASKFQRK